MSFQKDGVYTVSVTPKVGFLMGIGLSALLLLSVGFFILLAIFLSGRAAAAGESCGVDLPAAQPTAGVRAPSATPPPSRPVGAAFKKVTADDHLRGAADAPVTIVEYSDFECPYCGRFHPSLQRLMDEYDGRVNWVYRHFPLSFHPQARPAALASECAAEQGKFWEFADGLFENQTRLGSALFGELADDLGLNRSKFDDCLSSQKYADRVDTDLQEGQAAGVTGTPGSFIVGADGTPRLVPGAVPYEQLKAMIEEVL